MKRWYILLVILLVACEGEKMPFKLESSAFKEGTMIPEQYTCDHEKSKNQPDISPPLKWSGAPAGTKSFVLICDDPDAPVGLWVHWVLYDIPATITELPEDVYGSSKEKLPIGTKEGLNSWPKAGYGGPCPPDRQHRYFFKLYALNVATLNVPKNSTKEQVEQAMKAHVIGEAKLMGVYDRRSRRLKGG